MQSQSAKNRQCSGQGGVVQDFDFAVITDFAVMKTNSIDLLALKGLHPLTQGEALC
jgi:hypothetical protein